MPANIEIQSHGEMKQIRQRQANYFANKEKEDLAKKVAELNSRLIKLEQEK
jgi:hypothetical protein